MRRHLKWGQGLDIPWLMARLISGTSTDYFLPLFVFRSMRDLIGPTNNVNQRLQLMADAVEKGIEKPSKP
jgi:hypothetical protein